MSLEGILYDLHGTEGLGLLELRRDNLDADGETGHLFRIKGVFEFSLQETLRAVGLGVIGSLDHAVSCIMRLLRAQLKPLPTSDT